MVRYTKFDNNVLQFFVILMACITINAMIVIIGQMLGPKMIGRSHYLIFPIIFLWYIYRNYKIDNLTRIFTIALFIGYFLHIISGTSKDFAEETLHTHIYPRLIPFFLLSIFLNHQYKFKTKAVTLFALAFFIIECVLSYYERITMNHLIDYRQFSETWTRATFEDNTFRSFSLMFHPLFNANTVSVFMGFILVSNNIKFIYKYALLALGFVALWGFNSRGVLLVWFVILLYRIALYNRKLWQSIIIIVLLYFALPVCLDWLTMSGLLGRLEGFDFSDSSTGTRIIALNTFLTERWHMGDIVAGGRYIYYPGTTTTLENGVLLDLARWGLIIGPIKICGEILITYFALSRYPFRAKVIIMLAMWGVSFMNNNSEQNWLVQMYVLAFIGLACFQDPELDKKKENPNHTRRQMPLHPTSPTQRT